jgi:uncharacterized repeat protein (TIGR02543 family)
VGSPIGGSSNIGEIPSLVILNDIPVVFFQDAVGSWGVDGTRGRAFTYVGTQWVQLGQDLGKGPFYCSLKVYAGVLYLAFGDDNVGWLYYYDTTLSEWVSRGGPFGTGAGASFTNLDLDATGKPYVAFIEFSPNQVGVWTLGDLPSHSVLYNGRGNDGGTVPVDILSPYVEGHTVTVLPNTGFLSLTGFTFAGWNTAGDYSGTDYIADDTFVMGTAPVVLYAKWAAPVATVTYDGNGTEGVLDPTSYPPGGSGVLTWHGLPEALGGTPFEIPGYVFAGWNTILNGSGDAYTDNQVVDPWFSVDTILYAQWVLATTQVTITFVGNDPGAVNVPAPQIKTVATWPAQLSSFGTMSLAGHFFYSWNEQPNGSGVEWVDMVLVQWPTSDKTLYAQWKPSVPSWYTATLPEPKAAFASAVIGTKVLFAGGSINNAAQGPVSDQVNVYDLITDSWATIHPLYAARMMLSAVTVGSKVIVAGGVDDSGIFFASPLATVDIYDFSSPESPTWSRSFINDGHGVQRPKWGMATASVGNKAIFAGGYAGISDRSEVNVYDTDYSDTPNPTLFGGWTEITPLSVGRSWLTSEVFEVTIASTVHTLVAFAGGYMNGGYDYSDVIDVYDFTGTTPVLLDPVLYPALPSRLPGGARAHLSSAVVGNMLVFAGGEITETSATNVVDVYNLLTEEWLPSSQVPTLSVARASMVSTVVGNTVMFAGGQPGGMDAEAIDVVDVFDFTNPLQPTRSSTVLPLGPRTYMQGASAIVPAHGSIPVGPVAVFAGGNRGDVYGDSVTGVDIFRYTPGPPEPPEPVPPGYGLFTFDNMKFDFYIQENIDFSELSKVAEIVDLTKL